MEHGPNVYQNKCKEFDKANKLEKSLSAIANINFTRNLSQDLTQRIAELEAPFSENNFMGRESNPPITKLKGEIPIIISAPHAVTQLRNGKPKFSEPYTGAITTFLNEKVKTHGIIKSKYDGTDPNHTTGIEYKAQLMETIKQNNIEFLLDLHCMRASRSQQIVIGTDFLNNLKGDKFYLDSFIDIMKKNGFERIEVDTIFKAQKPYNISKYISTNADIPTMQVEVNMNIINPKFEDGKPVRNFVRGLREFALLVKKHQAESKFAMR